jgi:macrolide-specific efflux system membrane fusion protein
MTAEQANTAGASTPRPARRRWRRRAIIATLVLAPVAAWFIWFRHPAPPPAPPSAVVERTDIEQRVQAVGVVQAQKLVTVGAQASGQVQKLHVTLGQHVAKGDLLVSLDPELARNDVRHYEAALVQQQAQIQSTQVDLDQARLELQRQQKLFDGQAAAHVDLEKARNDVAKLDALLRLQQAQAGTAEADLEKSKLNLGFTQIVAPMEGDIVDISVQEGQTVLAVQQTPTLLNLARLDVVTIKAQVAEADIGHVSLGQLARFYTLGDSERAHEGRVRLIQPQPEKVGTANFYDVLFDVPNADRALMLGMSVQVTLVAGRAAGTLSIPMAALGDRDTNGHYTVQVLKADGKTEPRTVSVGLSDAGRAQILQGLKAGEKVLLAPPSAASAASAGASR